MTGQNTDTSSNPKLWGLGGKLRSGKDTVADYLVEKHGWVKLNMSDPLNDALLALDPWVPTRTDVYGEVVSARRYSLLHRDLGYTEAKTNPEVRRLLQALGTDVGRNMIGQTTWTDIAQRRILELQDQGKSVAITGIRFPNEFEMIEDLIGTTVWVTRPSLQTEGAMAAHASETSVGVDDFQIEILNDGSLDDLYAKVDKLVLGL